LERTSEGGDLVHRVRKKSKTKRNTEKTGPLGKGNRPSSVPKRDKMGEEGEVKKRK